MPIPAPGGTVESLFVATRLGRVSVLVAGQGPAVLLFHINRQSSDLYRELMACLAPNFTAVAMDYPSYGGSDHVSETPSIDDYAACAVAVLDALSIDAAMVVGEAVGSAVATAFATRFPERCKGAVMINVPALADRASASSHIGDVRKKAPSGPEAERAYTSIDAFLEANHKHAPLRPTLDWIRRVHAAHHLCGSECWQAADALIDFDLKSRLSELRRPATLLTGEFSPFLDYRQDVESRVQDLVSCVVPQSRFAVGWEKADEVAAEILALSRRIEPT